ncbi:DUF3515 family protein [Enemella evansiae]|uniref:DUF3515 family protein n=1 Tax=Enemella evansiae TaxID=2016499 RepID=UPI0010D6FD44|nr:DUF3515 family protein [Enemella evansiae]TDO92770.1 uncharacterized protein DUF3515 [Enemella evansiae]
MRPRRTPPLPLALTTLVAVGALAGCGSTVQVTDPPVAADVRTACDQVITALPDKVLGKQRRGTSGSLSGAWGEPPITVVCGIAEPEAMQRDTRCFEVNGVGWYAEQGQGGWLFTTIGRTATIQVGVPNKYAPEADALVDLAAAVATGNPSQKPCL